MFLTTIITTATIGGLTGAVCYLISNEDRKKMKLALRTYLEEPDLNYSYNSQEETFVLSAPTTESFTKIKISETESTITCVLYFAILQDLIPVYQFKYDKKRFETYDIKEEYFFGPNKGKQIHELLEQFTLLVISEEWKTKINYWTPLTKKTTVRSTKINEREQVETDPDIRYQLDEIEKKVNWLKNTRKLEIEEEHKIDTLKEDMEQILNAYYSFRDETKGAFKEKIVQALHEIQGKLNEVSIKKEEAILSDIDKTISLIKKR